MNTNVTPLVEDIIRPAGMFDPELTYYADGTHVVVHGAATTGGALRNGRTGVTQGRTVGSFPYPFQVVRWDDDGTTDNVAPHVLARVVGTGEYGGGECVYTLDGHDTDGTPFYRCHAHDATEVSPDAPCANAPHGGHEHEDDERTCDRHGGTWGGDPTCPKCTTPDGEPRATREA